MYEAGMTPGVRLNKARPDFCPYGGENRYLPKCEAALSVRRNILP
jgi:hypothetical protein